MANKSRRNVERDSLPRPAGTVSYQHASGGVDEILRPTLIVSAGRSYRKLTDIEFGRRPEDRAREKERAGRREEERSWRSEPERVWPREEEGKEWREERRVVTHKAYTG